MRCVSRRSFALSFVCHAGLLLLALVLYRPGGAVPVRGGEFHLHPEVPPLAPEYLEQPELVIERPEDPLDLLEEAEEEEQVCEVIATPMPRSSSRPIRITARLSRPLRIPKRLKTAVLPPAPKPQPRPKPEVVRPKGPSRAPLLVSRGEGIRYPRRARREGWEGVVELRILVGRKGAVEKVEVVRSSGHPILDEAAKESFLTWRFRPALRDGKPMAAWVRPPAVRFRLTVAPQAARY